MSRIENPMAQDELLLYRLYRIHATAAPLVVRMCEQEYGITRREWRILSSLVNREGVLSSELASIAMLDRARAELADRSFRDIRCNGSRRQGEKEMVAFHDGLLSFLRSARTQV